ncbi:MAG: carboxypeptidase regulatory-like domain-containing protein, partial [Blastocatellia bacterium]|nr:carboxypeptidase regulatory-like domain-containing protein [Blastocatellia bacterium]
MYSPRTHHTAESITNAGMKAALALTLLTLMSYIIFAQQGRGTIQGTVVDANGAAVAGAKVTITGTATNLSFNAVTGAEGFFLVPNLNVGGYSVTVTKDGFKKVVQRGIVLEVDQKAEIN